MASKVSMDSEKERALGDFLPTTSLKSKTASPEPTAGIGNVQTQESTTGNGTGDSIHIKDTVDTTHAIETTETLRTEATVSAASKRTSSKQRKESLEEYREAFLQVPKLDDRKPVFVSREVRDRLDELVRKLGGRKMSVSGFIENLALHHLETYHEDLDVWKKL